MAQVLSGVPTISGLTLPQGCTNVKVKNVAPDPTSSSAMVDVTTLADTARVYAAAPLIDGGSGANSSGLTATVTCSFIGYSPSVTSTGTTTGWICTEVETEQAVGEYVKGTATYVYKPT
jgi:hypothetical protein